MANFISSSLKLIVFLLIPLNLFAQAETTFNNINFGNSVSEVTNKLKPIADLKLQKHITTPLFPLASSSETHLVYNNVKTNHGAIDVVVFTFSDNKLCYIEATGNAAAVLSQNRKDKPKSYLHYQVYFSELVIINTKKDKVWLLTPESAHPNLFTWENPYVDPKYSLAKIGSGKIPDFIKMGASIQELEPILKANSLFTNTVTLDGSDPNAQTQIDCFGVQYLGFPRKIEARFGDGQLKSAWILTGKGEENRIREKLISSYGNPIFVNDTWEIFNDWTIGLRKDKPEILLLTKELGQHYKKTYFKQE